VVYETKIKTKNRSYELFFNRPRKTVFFGIYVIIVHNSLKDSSQTKCQKNKIKIILESFNLPLRNNIKIFILGIHRNSYGHLK
jgi:hypothetical protein